MTDFIYIIYAAAAGIVQGITEWLPVSSTGHLILMDSLVGGNLSPSVMTESFKNLFDVVIQLGSVAAVIVLYFKRLFPFLPSKSGEERKETLSLWGKIILASVPAGAAGLLLDGFLSEHVFSGERAKYIVAASLFFYGVVFIVIERRRRGGICEITSPEMIDRRAALVTGAFQILSLIPGTSRSGSTMIGASVAGVSRSAAAEFSFFLAIPVMFGASALKCVKFFLSGGTLSGVQGGVLAAGCVSAFLVSLAAVRFLVGFVKRRGFEPFGWYRIALSAVVVAYFTLIK